MGKGLFNISEKMNTLGGKISEPSVTFVIERDDISMTVRVGYIKRNLELLSLPKPIKVDKSGFIEQGISVDLDFFSTKIVERGTLDVEAFITTYERSARKVIENVFI